MKLKDRVLNRLKYYLRHKPKKSLNQLDDVIQKYLNIQGGTFIEVGANNGVIQSNTYYLEVCKGWRGLLIEPVERLYKECVWNRPKSIVLQRALVSVEYENKYVTIHDSNLMSIVQSGDVLSDAEQAHLARGREVQGLENSPQSQVVAETLSSVIERLGEFERVDLFSLDVEGFELEVLKGIDFSRHRPQYILVETAKFEAVCELLEFDGYEFLEKCSHHDFVFKDGYSTK